MIQQQIGNKVLRPLLIKLQKTTEQVKGVAVLGRCLLIHDTVLKLNQGPCLGFRLQKSYGVFKSVARMGAIGRRRDFLSTTHELG